jgi:RNA polymerase sigma factor (sigma-70 family)
MDNASTAVRAAATRPRWSTSALEATRQSLLTRLKDHADHDGWQRFFDTFGGVIHALALKAGLSASEADEALQETLVSVAREMPDFRYDPSRGSFKGWLFQITRRRIVDQVRKRVLQPHQSDQTIDQLADPAADPLSRDWDEDWRHNQIQLALERVKQ